eukprot:3880477-Amphidinium_carterae.1
MAVEHSKAVTTVTIQLKDGDELNVVVNKKQKLGATTAPTAAQCSAPDSTELLVLQLATAGHRNFTQSF